MMRQIREGSLSMAQEMFDPTESLKIITEIFQSFSIAKNVPIFLEIGNKLSMPNDSLQDAPSDNKLLNPEKVIPKLVGD